MFDSMTVAELHALGIVAIPVLGLGMILLIKIIGKLLDGEFNG